ncbi:unnamed protein product [Echinostoma caproni]|uniref:Sodium-coupled monocarboxylate transporter 2 n=1 Tax=Echinostoma caproni TaxID=27848 RepID=A0A183ACB2_9TREM|nr:unnamed protein product [Echinostoma caproni]
MFVKNESMVLSWPDYILYVGVLIVYATFRVFVYSQPFIRRRLKWFTTDTSRWSLDENEMNMFARVEDKQPSASLGTTTLLLFMIVYTVATETYGNGTQLFYLIIAHLLASAFMAHLYMPLFHELEINNIHESCFRLALWANVTQVILGMIGPMLVLIFGVKHVGGSGTMWDKIKQGGLVNFDNFNGSPFTEYSFFTVVVGGLGVLLSILAINPIEIEQYSSTIYQKNAKIGIYTRSFITWIFYLILCICGFVGYNALFGCNPLRVELTSHLDQMLAITTVILGTNAVALKGFLLGVLTTVSFSALTTLANSAGTMLARDVIASTVKLNVSRYTPGGLSRWIAFALCLLCIPIAFGLLMIPTSLFRSSVTFAGVFGGPLFTVVCLGMFLPWISNLGAVCGLLVSQVCGLGLLGLKLYAYTAPGRETVYYESIDTCEAIFPIHINPENITLIPQDDQMAFLDFSFMYIPAVCFFIGLIFALLMSIPSQFNANKIIDEQYFAWPSRRLFKLGGSSNSNLVSDSHDEKFKEKDSNDPAWSASTLHRAPSTLSRWD